MPTLTPEQTTGGVEVDDATGWALREGVVEILRGLALPGIPAENIVHRTFPNVEGLPDPSVVVAKGRGAFDVGPNTPCGQVDNRHAIYIVLVRSSQRELDGSSPRARQLDVWLEQAGRAFNANRPSIPNPSFCIIDSRPVDSDPQRAPEWIKQLDAVYLLVHITVREDLDRG